MSQHWNIQIKIQHVERPDQSATQKPNPILGAPRVIDELLNVAVSAGSEEEAYAKAHRLLDANRPERAMAEAPVATQQQAPGRRA